MALKGLWRNGWLSIAAISVMYLVFLSVNIFILFGNSFNTAISSIEDKVDFTVFFLPDASEAAILALRDDLLTNPLVKETHYVSKDDAYEIYRSEKPEIEGAIVEYGNPFSASLDIKTTDPNQLEGVAETLENNPLIKKIKYSKQTVDAINRGTRILRSVGVFLIGFLVVIAFLVTLNTVRLAIYNRGREIEIMKLVGATNWFIRWPFILEAVFDGLLAGLLATLTVYFAFDKFSTQLVDLSYLLKIPPPVFGIEQAFMLAVYQLGAGAILGAVSSIMAVRRHLRS